MSTLSMVTTRSVSAAQTDDHSFNTTVLFSCVGLVASFCLMILGVDLSAGWL